MRLAEGEGVARAALGGVQAIEIENGDRWTVETTETIDATATETITETTEGGTTVTGVITAMTARIPETTTATVAKLLDVTNEIGTLDHALRIAKTIFRSRRTSDQMGRTAYTPGLTHPQAQRNRNLAKRLKCLQKTTKKARPWIRIPNKTRKPL